MTSVISRFIFVHVHVLFYIFVVTGGSHLSCTAVKQDSCLAQIFLYQIVFFPLTCIIVLISRNTDQLDRFPCSQKIWLMQGPPVFGGFIADVLYFCKC